MTTDEIVRLHQESWLKPETRTSNKVARERPQYSSHNANPIQYLLGSGPKATSRNSCIFYGRKQRYSAWFRFISYDKNLYIIVRIEIYCLRWVIKDLIFLYLQEKSFIISYFIDVLIKIEKRCIDERYPVSSGIRNWWFLIRLIIKFNESRLIFAMFIDTLNPEISIYRYKNNSDTCKKISGRLIFAFSINVSLSSVDLTSAAFDPRCRSTLFPLKDRHSDVLPCDSLLVFM